SLTPYIGHFLDPSTIITPENIDDAIKILSKITNEFARPIYQKKKWKRPRNKELGSMIARTNWASKAIRNLTVLHHHHHDLSQLVRNNLRKYMVSRFPDFEFEITMEDIIGENWTSAILKI